MCDKNLLTIDLKTRIKAYECTEEFFKSGEFPLRYFIAKIKDCLYGIVNRETRFCEITFTNIERLYEDYRYIYLLKLPDDSKILVKIHHVDIFCSKPFKALVKLFNCKAIIEDFNGKRYLVNTKITNDNFTFDSWVENEALKYIIEEIVPDCSCVFNNKKTIILKDGLKYSNVKFYFASAIYDDYLELFFEKDDKRSIIDTNNLRLYPGYFKCISDRIKGSDGNLYVIAQTNNNDEYIIRLNDYHSTRKQYESVSFINDSYAEAIDGDKRLIIRLKDFNEVYFD